ncbi:MAG: short-chain dehydrogenase, partial [Halomonas sp.]|nr:short-chain dehydrogenase [Halomonas sp.]
MLSFLPKKFTAVVVGANGGIGNAMVNTLLSNSQVGTIIAVSRSPFSPTRPGVESVVADVSTPSGRDVLVQHLDGRPVHLLFNAMGVLHDTSRGIQPEKRLEELNETSIAYVMHINAVTPALLLSSLKPCLQGKHPTIIA